MAKVVPTILATSPDEYATMLAKAEHVSRRVHVDITDGRFTDNRTINLEQVHVTEGTQIDLHLMVKDPAAELSNAIGLHPSLVILHSESEGDVLGCLGKLRSMGIKAGLAILPGTKVGELEPLVKSADHILIFTGELGHNGGQFQTGQLSLASQLRAIKPELEISVDGGVNPEVAALSAIQGVDVLYVGGYIQGATDPKVAYDEISSQLAVST